MIEIPNITWIQDTDLSGSLFFCNQTKVYWEQVFWKSKEALQEQRLVVLLLSCHGRFLQLITVSHGGGKKSYFSFQTVGIAEVRITHPDTSLKISLSKEHNLIWDQEALQPAFFDSIPACLLYKQPLDWFSCVTRIKKICMALSPWSVSVVSDFQRNSYFYFKTYHF